MTWTVSQQTAAEATNKRFRDEFKAKMDLWKNNLSGGKTDQSQASVEDVLRRWRENMQALQASSASLIGDDSVMDRIGVLATKVASERVTLKKLQSESGTRTDQAASVNSKIRGSPSTNILWLNRMFRKSTRVYLLIFSIIFGALALGGLVYFIISTGVFEQMFGNSSTYRGGHRK